ncbi:MAG: GNAT family N-acetyltransferase [Pseudomonadales bacterium]|nr:GNAT family N-acetyltransferase [Pseudomonadales bacterium]
MIPTRLPFPLNVYAQTLALEYGEVVHLHFGLYASSDSSGAFPEAQRRAEDALCALLPPPPARIIEVGCGSGALACRLAEAGYEVLAITPLAAEFEGLSDKRRPGLLFQMGDLPDEMPAKRADVLLLQQSAQYMDPLQLFTRSGQHLREGGRLLIADEFTLDDSVRQVEPRPVLAHFLRLAHRCGFSAERQRELGRQVAPGLQFFAQLLLHHRDALLDQGVATQDQLTQLQARVQEMAQQYASAHLGCTLLDLRYDAVQGEQPEFGNIHSFSGTEVPRLFERSFDTPFDADIWQWKYGEGRGRAVCARLGGELVGHYGGAPRDILYFGAAEKAIQICDVMVMPEHRSFASRDTLFFKMAATFLELEVGNCAEHLLGVGFPNMRVLRIARRLGLYEITDSLVEIHYPTEAGDESWPELELKPFDLGSKDSGAHIDRLWAEMAPQMQDRIVGVRDGEYWRYRYLAHPGWARGQYRCMALCARDTGEAQVILLLREHEGAQLLMDLVGAPEQFATALAVLRESLARDSQSLRCRITRSQAEFLNLPGARQVDLGIEIPCNIWTRGPDVVRLRDAWWLTAGDMDFL